MQKIIIVVVIVMKNHCNKHTFVCCIKSHLSWNDEISENESERASESDPNN